MLTFFQTVCKLCIEYYCSSCKFEIPVRLCSTQQNSFPNSFHPRLKTFVLYKSFLTAALPFFYLNISLRGFSGLFTVISEHICFSTFFVSTLFSCRFPCGRLSWLMLAFKRTLKKHLVSYRIVTVRPTTIINLRESLIVNRVVNFYTSESVSLSFLYISCDVY